jgi:hypothetical protein
VISSQHASIRGRNRQELRQQLVSIGLVQFVGFITEERIAAAGHFVSVFPFGVDEISGTDPNLPIRI